MSLISTSAFIAGYNFKLFIDALTKKEHEVLKCLALGMANKTIASTLNNSDGTIRNHVSQILEKLGVTDRTQAVIKAINEGII